MNAARMSLKPATPTLDVMYKSSRLTPLSLIATPTLASLLYASALSIWVYPTLRAVLTASTSGLLTPPSSVSGALNHAVPTPEPMPGMTVLSLSLTMG